MPPDPLSRPSPGCGFSPGSAAASTGPGRFVSRRISPPVVRSRATHVTASRRCVCRPSTGGDRATGPNDGRSGESEPWRLLTHQPCPSLEEVEGRCVCLAVAVPVTPRVSSRRSAGRRNLTPYQRSELALAAEPLLREQARAQQGKRTDLSQKSVKSIDTQKEVVVKFAICLILRGVDADTGVPGASLASDHSHGERLQLHPA